ncbi:MAG: hypothetical protein IJO32_01325 [Bacilli bacterium]|nr:hypothetical protein [Bacilli bacterium]
MRKIIIIVLILIILSLFKYETKEVFKESYDIIYKKGEVGITFILESDINALLINNNDDENDLIILDYSNINKLINELKKFKIPKIKNLYNITPVIIKIDGIESSQIKPKNNIIELEYNSKKFCIYINDNNFEKKLISCDFIYMYKFNKNINLEFDNNTSIVFQNNNNQIPIKLQENLYQNWIDIYTINSYEYTTLKILKDGFDTIIIPIIK